MTRSPSFVVFGVVAAVALGLTACAEPSAPELPEGPLTKYLNQIDDSAAQSDMFSAEIFDKIEESVAACMSAEGFEYTPEKYDSALFGGDEEHAANEEALPESGTLEFAKTYGFGIAVWPGDEEFSGVPEEDVENAVPGPNEAYVSSLSDSEAEAYFATLYGVQDEAFTDPEDLDVLDGEEMSTTHEESSPENLGCYGKAETAAIPETTSPFEDPAYADLWDALGEFWSSEDAPSVTVELDKEWADCMSSKGQKDAAANGRMAVSDGLYEEYEQLTVGDGDNEFIELDAEQNRKFTDREIKLAAPDAECAVRVKYDERLNEAYNELEQEFVDQHKAQLDALVASVKKKSE